MADEKKNTGPEEAVVTEAPSPENPSGPSVPPAPEQEAEQGTIPGMEEKSDPTETVIDLTAARKAAKEQPAPEAGGEGPGGEGEKKPARRGRRPKAEQEAPSSGKPGAAGKAKRSRAAKKEKAPRKRRKLRKKRKPPRPERQGRRRRPRVRPCGWHSPRAGAHRTPRTAALRGNGADCIYRPGGASCVQGSPVRCA